MPIKKGDKIKVDYTGKLDDGTVFDSSTHGDHSHPLEFEVGSGMIIPGFENAVMGMEKGEEKNITLEPKDAYGDYNNELLKKIPRDKLPQDQEIKTGMMLSMQLPNGQQFPAKVTGIEGNDITIDLNHPLAGKTLHFEIKVIDIS